MRSIHSLSPLIYNLLSLITQCSAYGGAEFCMLGNVEMHVVHLLKHGIDLLALGQERQVTNEHEVLDA